MHVVYAIQTFTRHCETYPTLADLTLDVIKRYSLSAVVTMAISSRASDGTLKTLDDVPIGQACKKLLDNGATIVSVNYMQGPEMTLELVKEIVKICPPEHVYVY